MERRNLSFYVLSIFLISVILGSGLLLYYQFHSRRSFIKQEKLELFRSHYSLIAHTFEKLSEAYLQKICIEDYAESIYTVQQEKNPADLHDLRKKFYSDLDGFYKEIREKGFQQLFICTAAGEKLLTLTGGKTFSVDINLPSVSVEDVNRLQQPVSGFEAGDTFSGYRYVYPLYYEEKLVGYAGFGVSQKAVIQEFQKWYPEILENLGFILFDSFGDLSDTEIYSPDDKSESFSADYFEEIDIALLESEEDEDGLVNILKNTHGDPFLFMGIPVLDAHKDIAGLFVSVDKSSELKYLNRAYLFIFISYGMLSAMLIAALAGSWLYKKQIEKTAAFDYLTGLYNRLIIDEFLSHALFRFIRYGAVTSLIMLDLDHFKQVNDTYGHRVGDIVLVSLSALLERTIRESDLAGRWGGEEIVVILPETDVHNAAILAQRLRKSFEEYHIKEIDGESVTASFGVIEICSKHTSTESIIADADRYMYKAKFHGRNRVCSQNSEDRDSG